MFLSKVNWKYQAVADYLSRFICKSIILAIFLCVFPQHLLAEKTPFPDAIERAKVVQKNVAIEIPGSLILGNGDLNGILWVRDGRLKFSAHPDNA